MRAVTEKCKGVGRGCDAFGCHGTLWIIGAKCQDQILNQVWTFISDLVDIPSALVMGISSVLTFVMNTTLPAVHRKSFALLE